MVFLKKKCSHVLAAINLEVAVQTGKALVSVARCESAVSEIQKDHG